MAPKKTTLTQVSDDLVVYEDPGRAFGAIGGGIGGGLGAYLLSSQITLEKFGWLNSLLFVFTLSIVVNACLWIFLSHLRPKKVKFLLGAGGVIVEEKFLWHTFTRHIALDDIVNLNHLVQELQQGGTKPLSLPLQVRKGKRIRLRLPPGSELGLLEAFFRKSLLTKEAVDHKVGQLE